ncbi:cytokinin hydroxylase-like [Zingiber officinale]|uniref:cytokinin hydroxylase-like n=1 Tax=Zingiber officinale TaxID=94328 RepID=UPI001C4BE946|nr:cytokinin hydroxylase-like [Zingiber officinale]
MTLCMGHGLSMAIKGAGLLLFLVGAVFIFWLSPLRRRRRLRQSGLHGPLPVFPLGNLMEMSRKREQEPVPPASPAGGGAAVSHDIHSSVFPYFHRWSKTYGKVFVYWLGTEPFLYVADPEFLRQATAGAMSKKWGKPNVFKRDRKPMFGNSLVMVDGDDWARHRHIISPAFSVTNLNSMTILMAETTEKMLREWSGRVAAGLPDMDVEKDITENAAEIIAKASFGMSEEKGKKVFEKLRRMQAMLFRTNRLVGVPFGDLFTAAKSYEAWRLGKEIDRLLYAIIDARKCQKSRNDGDQEDLLGLLLKQGRELTTRELVDECKTFFFGGHETTALALTWTLLLLGLHPEWQSALRKEVMEVTGETETAALDSAALSKLTKMGWVWNEVLRLYSPAPNAQRQARAEVQVGEVAIPEGTNMWVDVVGMHHDKALWGDDANEFRPERWSGEVASAAAERGGCRHRMGFLPFGFGGRICVGRNLTAMEFKIVLSLVLRRFAWSVSPAYSHSPRIMLSLRPSNGVRLILRNFNEEEDKKY